MDFIYKSSSSVPVSDTLTTLMDWTDITGFTAFTLVVNNANGSGDDLTDIQIDQSASAGADADLDVFPGVPAVPVAGGESSVGTFTATAAWLRIRAKCGTALTTSATILLASQAADSSAEPTLCLLADVKQRLGITTTEHDTAIQSIIDGVGGRGGWFDSECGRTLLAPAADVTEYYSAEGDHLMLRRYPVVSITSIKESYDYVFSSETAITEDEDWRMVGDGKFGFITRLGMRWLYEDRPDTIEVIYRGGYEGAGVTPATGEHALPADLREAAIQQCCLLFKRRDDIGLSAVGFEGGNFNKNESVQLLPGVRAILEKYKRKTL